MITEREAKEEILHLLQLNLPKVDVSRVDVRESADSDGLPSLDVDVVFRLFGLHEITAQANTIVDEFRTWLVGKRDDRFPYFSFTTEQDEKEISDSAA
jgi:hypothetical protein